MINPAVPEEAKAAWDQVIQQVIADPDMAAFAEEKEMLTSFAMDRAGATAFFREQVAAEREVFDVMLK